jgi:hypothetical protein
MSDRAMDLAAAVGVAAVITYLFLRCWRAVVKAAVAVIVFLAALGAVTLVWAVTGPPSAEQLDGGAATSVCTVPEQPR